MFSSPATVSPTHIDVLAASNLVQESSRCKLEDSDCLTSDMVIDDEELWQYAHSDEHFLVPAGEFVLPTYAAPATFASPPSSSESLLGGGIAFSKSMDQSPASASHATFLPGPFESANAVFNSGTSLPSTPLSVDRHWNPDYEVLPSGDEVPVMSSPCSESYSTLVGHYWPSGEGLQRLDDDFAKVWFGEDR